jgi:DNA repair exonuclease SbcCD ATPase subunit
MLEDAIAQLTNMAEELRSTNDELNLMNQEMQSLMERTSSQHPCPYCREEILG